MADVTLTVQEPDVDGLTVTRVAGSTANTYYADNASGSLKLLFVKTGAGACTVTFVTPRTVDGLAVANPTATVAATTGDVACGAFVPKTYNDALGRVSFTVDEATGLTIAAIKG